MSSADFERLQALFDAARALPPGQRAEFLSCHCPDEGVRAQVEALVAASLKAGDFLESPVRDFGTPSLADADGGRRLLTEPAQGTVIGSYRVIRELGRGGMGRVFLAERSDGAFDQRVAIKFVSGLPTEALLRRFHTERRILARLEHPNIARLLDGGETPQGDPYLVMEYVDGAPIDDFCTKQRLGVTGRLKLFLQVCDAVQYAHQRLVIHRDLKASNILVGDGGGPKLLDFGIAKLIADDATPAESTQTLFRMMTPESASPEQVRGDAVTTGTDVYALGILLYRLLTGRSPYGDVPLTGAAMMRAILEETPEPPSATIRRASQRVTQESIAADLDCIVLKALRKEPERRYGSVQQLADDLTRFLTGRPVLAVPDSRLYRAGKFLRRHRLSVAAGSIAALSILAAAGVALQQARTAAEQRARAEERLAEVRRLANSFMFEFHDAIADLPGALAARRLVVKRAAEHLDGLAKDVHDDVTLARELATANVRLADILGGGGVSNLGDLDGAAERYATALSMRSELAARENADPADVEALAQIHLQLSRFAVLRGDFEASEQHARVVINTLQILAKEGPATAEVPLTNAYRHLGYVLARRGRTMEALSALETARARGQQVLATRPEDTMAIAGLARTETDLADQFVQTNRLHEAIDAVVAARQRLEHLLRTDALNNRYKADLIYGYNTEGSAYQGLSDYPAAIRARERALALTQSLLSAEPDDSGMKVTLLLTRYGLGVTLLRAGQRTAGIEQLRQAIAAGQQILDVAPQHGFAQHQVASIRLELGEALMGDPMTREEGCRSLALGLAAWRSAVARRQLSAESAGVLPRFEDQFARCAPYRSAPGQ